MSFAPSSTGLPGNLFLQSDSLTVTGDMESLMLEYQVLVKGYQKPAVIPSLPVNRLQIVNIANNQPLATLNQHLFSALTQAQHEFEDSLLLDLAPYMGKTIVLQMESIRNLLGGDSIKQSRIHIQEFELKKNTPKFSIVNDAQLFTSQPQLKEFALHGNYPNPFNPSTTISFDLPQQSDALLEIFDISGRKIRTLVNRQISAGSHAVVWDGRNEQGGQAASGLYVYRIKAGDFVQTRKMLLMK